MNILNLVLILIVAGAILSLINRFIPMSGVIKSLLNIVVIVSLIIYVLQFFHLIQVILPMPNLL